MHRNIYYHLAYWWVQIVRVNKSRTYWDAIVAIAAPTMPRWKEYTSTGSKRTAEILPSPAHVTKEWPAKTLSNQKTMNISKSSSCNLTETILFSFGGGGREGNIKLQLLTDCQITCNTYNGNHFNSNSAIRQSNIGWDNQIKWYHLSRFLH